MSLPVSRNRSYSAISQVASVDLNDLQDQTIALHARLNDPRTMIIPWCAGHNGNGDGWNYSPENISSAGVSLWNLPIAIDVGRQITEVRVRANAIGAFALTAEWYQATDGIGTLIGSGTTATGSGSTPGVNETLVIVPASPVAIVPLTLNMIHISTGGAILYLFHAEVDYEWIP